jgi:hypothetical protein
MTMETDAAICYAIAERLAQRLHPLWPPGASRRTT